MQLVMKQIDGGGRLPTSHNSVWDFLLTGWMGVGRGNERAGIALYGLGMG